MVNSMKIMVTIWLWLTARHGKSTHFLQNGKPIYFHGPSIAWRTAKYPDGESPFKATNFTGPMAPIPSTMLPAASSNPAATTRDHHPRRRRSFHGQEIGLVCVGFMGFNGILWGYMISLEESQSLFSIFYDHRIKPKVNSANIMPMLSHTAGFHAFQGISDNITSSKTGEQRCESSHRSLGWA